jgi:hypothetical protein
MPPKNNPESWQQIHEFIVEFPNDATWSDWKQIARNIVTSLESLGLISQFRIGQSMSNIIFSTLEHHQVFGHRHVTISIRPDEKTVHVAYSTKSILFKSFIAEDISQLPKSFRAF